MKIRYALFFAAISIAFQSNAQQWFNTGGGIKADAGGGIFSMTVYKNNLYMAGWFYQAGALPVSNIAEWNASSWGDVGKGISGGYGNVYALAVYNARLYAGGAFYAAGDSATTDIAAWDGTKWYSTGKGMMSCSSSPSYIDALTVYNGKLYAGGVFCTAGGIKVNNIARWDGTKWDSVAAGFNGQVNTMCVYNGKLYAGGLFTKAGDTAVRNIAVWNDTTWKPVGKGIRDTVLSMTVYKGALCVGGNFDSAGGMFIRDIAQWNGSTWSGLAAKGITGPLGVGTMCTYDGCLIAGGYFSTANNVKYKSIARWNGTVWDSVGGGINNLVNSLVVWDSVLYAGGAFSLAGNTNVDDIAEWGYDAGVNEIGYNGVDINVYPNPSHGAFNISIKNYELKITDKVEVYNLMGEQVSRKPVIRNSQFVIDISNQPAGIYLYRVTTENGYLVGSGKLIIN